MLIIEIPGVPVGKGRPRFAKRGKFMQAYTPEKTRLYENTLAGRAHQIYGVNCTLLDGPLRVNVIACFPIAASWSKRDRALALAGHIRPTKPPDIDNIYKMLDALNGVVWNDDKQIVEGSFKKIYGERPFFRVEIEELKIGKEAGELPPLGT